MSDKLPISPRSLLEAKLPQQPCISPDGTRVVFAVAEADFEESRWVSRLWMAEIPDGYSRRITHSYEGERSPVWSPDGRFIAFLSARPDMTEPPPDDEEPDAPREQLWVLPIDGGEAYRLTKFREGVREFRWMPDSLALVCLAPESRTPPVRAHLDELRKRRTDPVVEGEDRPRMQFWGVTVEDPRADLIYTGDQGIQEFDLSHDGGRIAFSSNGTGDPNDYHRTRIWLLSLEDLALAPLPVCDAGQAAPLWSPDDRQIAFICNLDPTLSYSQYCVQVVDLGAGTVENRFAGIACDAHDILWPGGDVGLLCSAGEGTNVPLLRLADGRIERATRPDGPVDCSDFHALAGGPVVAVLEDDRSLPELYLLLQDGERKALTELNLGFSEKYEIPRQEVVRWQSDEWTVEGVLVHPPAIGEGPHPLVVQVHGGPHAAATNTLWSYYQHTAWAAAGYLVFMPNYRGSEGYGNAFAVANRRDLGGGDFRDVMSGIDALVEQGLADAERIGIMGGSYGGYMANWAVGMSERFRAAVSMFGVFSLISDYSNSEISRWETDYMGAHYWDDPGVYARCSPMTYANRIKTPVLIIHGQADRNTSPGNSRELYRVLREREVPVRFIQYPREGHGLSEPNHKLDEIRECIGWMDRWLAPSVDERRLHRVDDRVMYEGMEMRVTRAVDGVYLGMAGDSERLLDVSIIVESVGVREHGLGLSVADLVVTDAAGRPCPLRGVPVEAGGGRVLVGGEGLQVSSEPDRDTGRVGIGFTAAYAVPDAGGVLEARFGSFPPIRVDLPMRAEKDDNDSAEDDDGESGAGMAN